MLTQAQNKELYDMVKAIYNHLGIDGRKPVDINQVRKQAEKDVLKYAEKKRKRSHGLEETCTR